MSSVQISRETPVEISTATSPANLDAAQGLLKELTQGLQALFTTGSDPTANDVLRQDMSTKARDLMLALETPRETSIKHIWAEVSTDPFSISLCFSSSCRASA